MNTRLDPATWMNRPTMLYFGRRTSRNLRAVIPAPLGLICGWCKESFAKDDVGVVMSCIDTDGASSVAYHQECLTRSVVGSVGHIQGKCSCFGGNEEDPPEMTAREAAKAAVSAFAAATYSGDGARSNRDGEGKQ